MWGWFHTFHTSWSVRLEISQRCAIKHWASIYDVVFITNIAHTVSTHHPVWCVWLTMGYIRGCATWCSWNCKQTWTTCLMVYMCTSSCTSSCEHTVKFTHTNTVECGSSGLLTNTPSCHHLCSMDHKWWPMYVQQHRDQHLLFLMSVGVQLPDKGLKVYFMLSWHIPETICSFTWTIVLRVHPKLQVKLKTHTRLNASWQFRSEVSLVCAD